MTLEALEQLKQARRRRTNQDGGEPLRIPYQEPEVLPFPVDVLPQPLRDFAIEVSEHVVCPLDYVAMSMLTVVGALIGNSVAIQTDTGWRETARIWTIVVGDSGSGKSPAIEHVLNPLVALQTELNDEYKNAYRLYEAQLETWSRENGDPKPEPPVHCQTYATDTTLEALQDVLLANPRGVLVYWDEASGFMRSFGQYKNGAGADKQQILTLWNCTQWTVNRRGRPPVVIDRPFVAFLGGIQPAVLSSIRQFTVEDGFAYRFLLVYPEKRPRRRSQTSVSRELRQVWSQTCLWLWQLPFDVEPKTVSMTPDGTEAWHRWLDEHYQEVNGLPQHLTGVWSKFDVHALRLALVVHMLRAACGEIEHHDDVDADTIARVTSLVSYLKSHAQRVYEEIGETEEDKRVRLAMQWIRKKGGCVTIRDLVRFKVANCKSASDAELLIRLLQERGHVQVSQQGRTTVIELVNEVER